MAIELKMPALSPTMEQGTLAKWLKAEGDRIALMPTTGEHTPMLPPIGALVRTELDWDRRHRHMRVHTALHLLSVVIPLPVSGGAIASEMKQSLQLQGEASADVLQCRVAAAE
jgi:Ser-tRNA(Ala) deacylase AlaX